MNRQAYKRKRAKRLAVRIALVDRDIEITRIIRRDIIAYPKAYLASWRIHRERVDMITVIGRGRYIKIIGRLIVDREYPIRIGGFMLRRIKRVSILVCIDIKRIRIRSHVKCLPDAAHDH